MKTIHGAIIKASFLTLFIFSFIHQLSAQCVTDPVTSLVTNGTFSSGNTGFISGYTRCTTSNCLYPEGYYAIGTNANFYHGNFVGRDHTTGTGNFMIVNGAGVANTIVWRQTITVKAGTDYNFSTWVKSLVAGSPAKLQFQINGITIGAIFNAPSVVNVWQNFFVTWNSGASTSAVITILNQNTTLAGNDFGLDDISFVEICNTPIPDLGSNKTLCGSGTVNLASNITPNTTVSITWDNGLSGIGAAAPYNRTVNAAGKYWVCVKDGPCVKTDTIEVIADFSVNLGPDFTLCAQTSFKLDAVYTNAFTTYKWYKDNVLINDSTSRTFTVRSAGLYRVEVKDASCSITRTDEVLVNAVSATPNDGTYCPPAAAVFSVTPNPTGGFKWYDASVGGNYKGKGNNLSVSGASGTVMMYAEDTTSFQYNVGPKEKFPAGFVNGASINDYIEFDAHTSFTLKSVAVFGKVYNPNEAITVGVTLSDNLGNILQQVTRNVTGPPIVPIGNDWPFTIPVNFNIASGLGYRLSNAGTIGDLFWASGAANNATWSTYKENGIITFKGMGPGYNYCTVPGTCFGYFYNWEIEKGNKCARVPVAASINCPTPVEWLEFEVKKHHNKNVLHWKTASEINSSQFTVERSYDGFLYESFGKIQASGDNSTVSNYLYEDKNVKTGIVYYRIKEIDKNGDYSYSIIRSVERDQENNISIHPNPNKGQFRVGSIGVENGLVTISIYNALGQNLYYSQVNNSNNNVDELIDISSFCNGVYILKVQTTNELLTKSFIKE
jgi:hypothetical protein